MFAGVTGCLSFGRVERSRTCSKRKCRNNHLQKAACTSFCRQQWAASLLFPTEKSIPLRTLRFSTRTLQRDAPNGNYVPQLSRRNLWQTMLNTAYCVRRWNEYAYACLGRMWNRLRCFLLSVAAPDVAVGAEMKFLNAPNAYSCGVTARQAGRCYGSRSHCCCCCCSVSVTERRF